MLRPHTVALLFTAEHRRHFAVPKYGGPSGYGAGGGAASGAVGAAAATTAGTAAGSAAGSAGAGSSAAGGVYNAAPWLFQPDSYVDLDKYGSVALPAKGTSATILMFTVSSGRMGKITALGINFTLNGSANVYTPDVQPFQLSFALTTSAVGSGFQDFTEFFYIPGSVQSPMAIAGLTLIEKQMVTVTVNNVGITADTQWVGAHVQGYTYSKKQHPKGLGYQ